MTETASPAGTAATGGGSPLGSVDKALLALESLAAAGPGGIPLGALADRLGLHKASLHRTLAALRYRGYVDQVGGRYRLGAAASALADVYLGEENLPALIQPALVAVCEASRELVHLGTLSGPEIVYLDKVEPSRAVRVWSAVGRRRPAATTALGRALLAFRPVEASQLAWYASTAGTRGTGAGPADDRPAALGENRGAVPADPARDVEHLRAALEVARELGYAAESEENEPGIACVAVPILRAGSAVAALSITAPVERMDAARQRDLADLLVRTAEPRLPAPFTVPRGAARVTEGNDL